MKMPTGNGYFVWIVERCGDPRSFAAEAKAANLSWIAVKIADGPYKYYGNNNRKDTRDRVKELVQALREVGISVWGWHYVYGILPEAEANVAIARMNELKLDGYIVDAEVEYKGRNAQAIRFMKRVRSALSTPIALCTYRFPTYHSTFPFEEFLDYSDLNMPQVYWQGAQNAGAQLQRSQYEYSKLTKIPFLPVGASYSEHGWAPTVASIRDFRATAKKLNVPAISWWEHYEAHEVPERWAASVDASTLPPNSDVLKKVTTKFTDLRYRSGPALTAKVLGYLKANTTYSVTQISGTWGYLEELGGWVHLGYCVSF